ncbi:MAG: hypothetical protein Q7R79_01990 [bacterium]|nr:hypothetical protein [bacterium]
MVKVIHDTYRRIGQEAVKKHSKTGLTIRSYDPDREYVLPPYRYRRARRCASILHYNVVRNFLMSRLGLPWNDVRSEIRQVLDLRRRQDQLVWEVFEWAFGSFTVDPDDGTLQDAGNEGFSWDPFEKELKTQQEEIEKRLRINEYLRYEQGEDGIWYIVGSLPYPSIKRWEKDWAGRVVRNEEIRTTLSPVKWQVSKSLLRKKGLVNEVH